MSGLLKYTGRSLLFVVVSDEVSHGLAYSYFNGHKKEFQAIITNIGSTHMRHSILSELLIQIKSSIRPLIFLYGDARIAQVLLWYAKDYRMIEESFLWIISENILHETEDLFRFPSLIYGIRLKGSKDIWNFMSQRLSSGLNLLQFSLEQTVMENGELKRTSSDCSDRGDWKQGLQLQKDLER